jgi:hypothetical protein
MGQLPDELNFLLSGVISTLGIEEAGDKKSPKNVGYGQSHQWR